MLHSSNWNKLRKSVDFFLVLSTGIIAALTSRCTLCIFRPQRGASDNAETGFGMLTDCCFWASCQENFQRFRKWQSGLFIWDLRAEVEGEWVIWVWGRCSRTRGGATHTVTDLPAPAMFTAGAPLSGICNTGERSNRKISFDYLLLQNTGLSPLIGA